MKKLTVVPIGGLANRMYAIASFVSYFRDKKDWQVEFIWVKDQGLNCSYGDLFEPLKGERMKVREANILDLMFRDRPRRRNFGCPRFFHPLLFDKRIYEDEYIHMHDKPELQLCFFEEIQRYKKPYVVACMHLYEEDGMFDSLKPVSFMEKKIGRLCSLLKPHTVGIHIRRTDNVASIEDSPLDLYIRSMQLELDKNPDVCFYVASDSMEEKHRLVEAFGDRIITSFQEVTRNTKEGIQDGMAEMYTLSRTEKIYGSKSSTFVRVAGKILGAPLVVFNRSDE